MFERQDLRKVPVSQRLLDVDAKKGLVHSLRLRVATCAKQSQQWEKKSKMVGDGRVGTCIGRLRLGRSVSSPP